MNVKEKILLVQLLLFDIRLYWGHGWIGKNAEERALKAISLCEEIANESGADDYIRLAVSCKEYISTSKDAGDWDGRWFRDVFPYGYENMDELHGLTQSYKDKSDAFKSVAGEYLTCPDSLFEDWENRFDD